MLTTAHIQTVLTHYDLGTIQRVTPTCQGNVNATAFVETTYGRFVVRRNQHHVSEAFHRYRHALIAHLYEHNFPVPALIPTRNGTTMLKLDGQLYEVQLFVEGKDYNPDQPQQLTSIGTTLAHYHRIVQELDRMPGEAIPRYSARCIQGLTERLMECDVMGDLWPSLTWYDARAAQLRAALDIPSYTRLPHRIIHGDMHADNLRFAGNRVVALLDYDQIAWDARIVDLADTLVSFATDTSYAGQFLWGVFKGPLHPERATRILAAYMRVVPLTRRELETLPELIELMWLQGALGRVISTLEGSIEYHLDLLGQGRWLSGWMRQHSPLLVEQWMALDAVSDSSPVLSMAA